MTLEVVRLKYTDVSEDRHKTRSGKECEVLKPELINISEDFRAEQ